MAIFLQIYLGAQIYFSEGPDKFAANLLEVAPSLSKAVPRLFEVLYDRIRIQIKNSGKLLQFAFNRTIKLGKKNLFNELNFIEKIEHNTYCKLIRNRITKRLGGGNLRISFTTNAISSYFDNINPSVSKEVPSPGILCTGDSL